jgi:hypothetical protein
MNEGIIRVTRASIAFIVGVGGSAGAGKARIIHKSFQEHGQHKRPRNLKEVVPCFGVFELPD